MKTIIELRKARYSPEGIEASIARRQRALDALMGYAPRERAEILEILKTFGANFDSQLRALEESTRECRVTTKPKETRECQTTKPLSESQSEKR